MGLWLVVGKVEKLEGIIVVGYGGWGGDLSLVSDDSPVGLWCVFGYSIDDEVYAVGVGLEGVLGELGKYFYGFGCRETVGVGDGDGDFIPGDVVVFSGDGDFEGASFVSGDWSEEWVGVSVVVENYFGSEVGVVKVESGSVYRGCTVEYGVSCVIEGGWIGCESKFRCDVT